MSHSFYVLSLAAINLALILPAYATTPPCDWENNLSTIMATAFQGALDTTSDVNGDGTIVLCLGQTSIVPDEKAYVMLNRDDIEIRGVGSQTIFNEVKLNVTWADDLVLENIALFNSTTLPLQIGNSRNVSLHDITIGSESHPNYWGGINFHESHSIRVEGVRIVASTGTAIRAQSSSFLDIEDVTAKILDGNEGNGIHLKGSTVWGAIDGLVFQTQAESGTGIHIDDSRVRMTRNVNIFAESKTFIGINVDYHPANYHDDNRVAFRDITMDITVEEEGVGYRFDLDARMAYIWGSDINITASTSMESPAKLIGIEHITWTEHLSHFGGILYANIYINAPNVELQNPETIVAGYAQTELVAGYPPGAIQARLLQNVAVSVPFGAECFLFSPDNNFSSSTRTTCHHY